MKTFYKKITRILLLNRPTRSGHHPWCANRSQEFDKSRTRRWRAWKIGILGMPMVLTSMPGRKTHKDYWSKTYKNLLPKEYENRVKRAGITNWLNVKTIKQRIKSGRWPVKNVIMAADPWCLHTYPSISNGRGKVLKRTGCHRCKVLAHTDCRWLLRTDFGKRPRVRTHHTINQIVAELIQSWATDRLVEKHHIVFEELFHDRKIY